MPALLSARFSHACCVVRDALVVLGGTALHGWIRYDPTSRWTNEYGQHASIHDREEYLQRLPAHMAALVRLGCRRFGVF
jgi:hypothetical protein